MRPLSDKRKAKFEEIINHRQLDLCIILENVIDSHNIAASLRACDAVGVQEIHLIHDSSLDYCKVGRDNPMHRKKTSGRVVKWVDLHYHESTTVCLQQIKQRYDKIYTTHIGEQTKTLYELDLTESVALLFGNERTGVTEEALALCDGNFIIPQVGMAQSLNISVACAVSLYEAYRQRMAKGMYQYPATTYLEQRAGIFEKWKVRDQQRRK